MTESWDLSHGTGAARHTNYVAELKIKTGICGHRGWPNRRASPTGVMLQPDRRSLFSGFAPTWETWRGGGNWPSAKRHASVFSHRYDAALSKQTSGSPGRTAGMVWYELQQLDVRLRLWFQGFVLMESDKGFHHTLFCCWITSANEESHPPSLDQTQHRGPVMKHWNKDMKQKQTICLHISVSVQFLQLICTF